MRLKTHELPRKLQLKRIWDDFVSDAGGMLSWSVGIRGEGPRRLRSIQQPAASTYFINDVVLVIFACDSQRSIAPNLRRSPIAALHAGSKSSVNLVGMDDPHYAINDDAFSALAAKRGFDWRW